MKLVPFQPVKQPEQPSTPLEYALRYAAIGWYVFPVWGAADGKCRCGRTYADESKHSVGKHPVEPLAPRGQDDATLDPATIRRWWTAMPEAGVAVFLRPSGLVAVDIDPRNGGIESIEDLEAKHGRLVSDVMAFTQAGGEHRVFKLAADAGVNIPGKLGPGIDLKRNGYIVVAPTQGQKGIYEWEGSSDPLEGNIASPLPDWIRDLSKATAHTVAASADRYLSQDQMLELKEALSYLSADDYNQWVDIGQALRSIGQQGFGLWDTWSQLSEKYDPRDMGKKWRSFKTAGTHESINYESIFKLAQDAGWVNPLSKAATEREEKLRELVKKHDRERPIEIIAKKEEPAIVRPFPVPMLDELCAYINRSHGIANSVATQMTAISIASLVASRLYESEFADGAHLYQLISAQTIGEMRPLHNAIATIMRDAGPRRLLREQRFSSPSNLFKTLMRSPATMYLASDWGSLAAFAKRQPSGAIEQVLHLLSHAHGQRDILLDNPEELGIKAAAGTKDDMPVIRRPSLSLLALSSTSLLSFAFATSEIGRGSVEQFIFHQGSVDQAGDPEPSPVPNWLIDHLRNVRRLPAGSNDLDLASIFNGNAETLPNVQMVRFTARPDEHYPRFAAIGVRKEARPLVQAARVNLRRLCVTLAAWANPADPEVTRQISDWAADFISDRLEESLATLRLVGGSDDGKLSAYQESLEAIFKAGSDGLPESGIPRASNRFRALSKDKRLELIDLLIEDGQVAEVNSRSGKGRRIVAAEFIKAENTVQQGDISNV